MNATKSATPTVHAIPKRLFARSGLALPSLLAASTCLSVSAAPRELFASLRGDDGNPGTKEQPFRTVPHAMQAVRQQEHPAGGVTVYLRGGTYALTERLSFGPEDSGTAESPVTYASYPGERAVLSGGRRLTGQWQQSPGKPYFQLLVPEARNRQWVFNSLYINGRSRERARTPNWGEKVLRAEGRAPGEDERQAFQYRPGDIDAAWTNLTDADLVLLCSWTPTIHRIDQVLPDRRVVRFRSSHTRAVDAWEQHFRYYVSNVFEALGQPGEWYLNRDTGMLYYYPLPGEDVAAAEVIAPVVKSRLVELVGDVAGGKFVEHLQFRDLDFRHVDGDLDRYNGVYRQGHMYLDATIYAEGLRSSAFVNCEIAQVGEYAMELADGCRDDRVEHCHIWDVGAGAMQLGVTDLNRLLGDHAPAAGGDWHSEREVLRNVIDNNFIHRLGTLWHGCYGIVNRFASLTQITHNEISDTHWDALGLDARWNWQGETYSHGNVVAYNHLHHLGLRYHTDAAGVYQFGPLDTHIHHNLIHDTVAYPYICGYAGVYLDEQSRGALVENNLVYNIDWFAYFQHKGMDNLFRNNIGAFARDGLFSRGGLNEQWRANYCEAYRNVYVANDAVALRNAWDPGLKPPVLHDNLYFSLAAGTDVTFAGKSFVEWQAQGLDQGSVVGDPGFVDPARYDFSLKPGAAALKAVGFVPFDDEIKKVGLYGDDAWRKLPEKHTPRTPSAVWTPEDLAKLIAFRLDFEDLPDGYGPSLFRLAKEGDATFAVTSEAAATGKKSYKCTDRKGLKKAFYPYIHLAPRKLGKGRVSFRFDAMLHKEQPAPFYVEFRGAGSTDDVGPSIRFSRDGTIEANGKTVLTAEPGTWCHFEIAFELGAEAPKEYSLVTEYRGERQTQRLPFRHQTFSEISWVGISASEDADGVFYLDEVELRVE
jgi:hypothetical protein